MTGRHGRTTKSVSYKQDTTDFRLTEVTESTGHRYSLYHLYSVSCTHKISCFHRQRDSLVDSLWAISETTLFLLSGEKILTLTSHREGPFYSINFQISQNNHISPCFASYNLGFSPICPRRPGEGWEPSGGGFAPLHRPFGRPAFFVAGPRVTEVSLSGSTRRLSYSVFKVLRWSLVKAYQKVFLFGSDS